MYQQSNIHFGTETNPAWGNCAPHRAFRLLRILCSDYDVDLKVEDGVLVLILAYTDTIDPWTSEETRSEAVKLLSSQLLSAEGDRTTEFIRHEILKGLLPGVFSSSADGVPVTNRPWPSLSEDAAKLSAESSWKKTCPHACTVLGWSVDHAQVSYSRRIIMNNAIYIAYTLCA